MSSRRIVTLLGLLLLVGAFIIAATHSQQAELASKQNPIVINHTQRLAVISAVRNGGELYIALRNDYAKNIMAYAISIGNFQVTEDFAWSGFAKACQTMGLSSEEARSALASGKENVLRDFKSVETRKILERKS